VPCEGPLLARPNGTLVLDNIRTARSRTSGECLLALAMTPSSQGIVSAAIPGRFRSTPTRELDKLTHWIEYQAGSLTSCTTEADLDEAASKCLVRVALRGTFASEVDLQRNTTAT